MNKSRLRTAPSALYLASSVARTLGLAAAYAATIGAAAGLVPSSSLAAPDPQSAAEVSQLTPFEVTGSRIPRVDYEPVSPITVFSAADLETKGYLNVGDFVQSLSFNEGVQNATYQPNSFTRGAATANPRGLGAQRFLTLVNGRRVASYALLTSGNLSIFDLNSLPAAAIESIEVLKDGASAIYGADAITGVVNIKLKQNFDGLLVAARYSNTLRDAGRDTGTVEFSAVAGAKKGRTRLLTALSAKVAHSSYVRDYGVENGDFTYLGPNKGLNQNSTFTWPSSLTLTAAQASTLGLPMPAGVTSWTYVVRGGVPTAAPTLASFVPAPTNPAAPNQALIGNENRFNTTGVYSLSPAYDYVSNYTSVEHDVTAQLQAFANVVLARNSTYYAYTPTPIVYSFERLTLPAGNPYNPFGIPLATLSSRENFGPASKFDVTSRNTQLVAGLRGRVLDSWRWESAGSFSTNRVGMIWRNAVPSAAYQAALNGTLSGFSNVYLNPFGPSDANLTRALFVDSPSSYRQENRMWDLTVSGTLLRVAGRDISLAAGGEWRNERLVTRPDPVVYIGGGGTGALSARRSVGSEYVELGVPLLDSREVGKIELQVAGRHEHYSDFGNTTNPKYGAKWRLPDLPGLRVILRGSYSESFQAPALGLVYANQTVGFSPGVVQDPLRPQDPPVAQRIVTGGNPGLDPETARAKYAGAVLEDVFGIRNLSVSADYLDLRVSRVIVTPSINFLLSAAGRAQFPNAIVRESGGDGPGPIVRIETVPQNNPAGYQMYRGFDYGLRYAITSVRFGRINVSADATQLLKTGSDSGLGAGFYDNTGLYYYPRWRANGTLGWERNAWAASVAADWTSHFYNNGYTTAGWAENPSMLVHARVSHVAWRGAKLTVGSSNLFDRRPPLNGREPSGLDPKVYGASAIGRIVYVQIEKKF